jgi:hypothetical protein
MTKNDLIQALAEYPDNAEIRIKIITNHRCLYRNAAYIHGDETAIWIDVYKNLRDDTQMKADYETAKLIRKLEKQK